MRRIIKPLARLQHTLQVPAVADLREQKINYDLEELRLTDPDRYAATVKHLRKAYDNIVGKCYRPNNREYKRYGGRGIGFWWRGNRQAFVRDVIRQCGLRPSPQHSLDRWPDNNSCYKPGNLRWATKPEQATNRRPTKMVRVGDVDVARPALARAVGVRPDTLATRIRRQEARIDPQVLAFEANWNDRMREKYGRQEVLFSDEQKLEVMKAYARLKDKIDLVKVAGAALMHWQEFREDVEFNDGLITPAPGRPRLEFFLKHLEAAVMFRERKLKELAELREGPKRRERFVRDWLAWRKELANEGEDPGDPWMLDHADFDESLYERLKPEYGF